MDNDSAVPRIQQWPLLEETVLGRYTIFTLSSSVRASPTTGRRHRFFRLDTPDWVNVVPLTTVGTLILVDQYRHGTDRSTLEIPGGAVDPNEDPAAAAARELEEETGYRPGAIHLLGVVEPNPAFLSNSCWTFLATGCEPNGVQRFDPAEEIALRMATLAEFTTLIEEGTIRHALVVAAHDHLQRAIRRREPWAPSLANG